MQANLCGTTGFGGDAAKAFEQQSNEATKEEISALSPRDQGGREPERGEINAPPLPDPLLHSAEERESSGNEELSSLVPLLLIPRLGLIRSALPTDWSGRAGEIIIAQNDFFTFLVRFRRRRLPSNE